MFELPPLTQRPTELMDDPSLEAYQHQEALRALARIHFFSGTVTHIVRHIVSLLGNRGDSSDESIRVLDIACGGERPRRLRDYWPPKPLVALR